VRSSRSNSTAKWRSQACSSYTGVLAIVKPWPAPWVDLGAVRDAGVVERRVQHGDLLGGIARILVALHPEGPRMMLRLTS